MSQAHTKRGFLGFFTSHSPAVAAAILLAVGGAFAGTAAVVTKWIVTEEPVGDTQKHVVIRTRMATSSSTTSSTTTRGSSRSTATGARTTPRCSSS